MKSPIVRTEMMSLCAGLAVSAGLVGVAAGPAAADVPFGQFAALPDADADPQTIEVPTSIAASPDGGFVIGGVLENPLGDRAAVNFWADFAGSDAVHLDLQDPAGPTFTATEIGGLSADNTYAGGFGLTDDFNVVPIMWDGGIGSLLDLPDGFDGGSSDGVSDDGKTFFGSAFGVPGVIPVVWPEDTMFAPLALDLPAGLPFPLGTANDATTTPDGDAYAVGSAGTGDSIPLLWDAHTGQIMEVLDTSGFAGGEALSISDDGVLIGGGVNPFAQALILALWVADQTGQTFHLETPAPPPGFEGGRFTQTEFTRTDFQFRGQPGRRPVNDRRVAAGFSFDDQGVQHAVIFTDDGAVRTVESALVGELGTSIAPFTRLSTVADMKIAADGSILLTGLGDTPAGERGWAAKISPDEPAAGCNIADIADTFGVLDLADVDAFIAAFIAGDPLADLVDTFGVIDLADVDAFITAFLAGCP